MRATSPVEAPGFSPAKKTAREARTGAQPYPQQVIVFSAFVSDRGTWTKAEAVGSLARFFAGLNARASTSGLRIYSSPSTVAALFKLSTPKTSITCDDPGSTPQYE